MKKLFHSAIVLPFTAGHPYKNREGLKPHDGSISGFILLSSCILVTFLGIFGGSTIECGLRTLFAKEITLCIGVLIATIACIGLWIANESESSIITFRNHQDITVNLKLAFLWIFTIGSILYSVLDIMKIVRCKKPLHLFGNNKNCSSNFTSAHEVIDITYQSFQIVFYLIQSAFIHKYAAYQFYNSWKNYYSLLLIVFGNVSQWAHSFVHMYTSDIGRNTTDPTCTIENTMSVLRPIFHPIEMEYSLLSMIFIAYLWPENNTQSILEETIIVSDLENMSVDVESTPLLSRSNSRLNQRRQLQDSKFNFRSMICLTVCVLIKLPGIIFLYYSSKLAGGNDNNQSSLIPGNSTIFPLAVAKLTYEVGLSFLVVCLTVVCFYMVSQPKYFIPLEIPPSQHFHDKIIVVGFLGTVAYFSLEFLSCIMAMVSEHERTQFIIIQGSAKLIELYMQVVCILQLNHFRKAMKREPILNYAFFCLAVLNLCFWIEDSVFESPVDDEHIFVKLYNEQTWHLLSKFVFPIIIFFRFKSFIAFYGIFCSDK